MEKVAIIGMGTSGMAVLRAYEKGGLGEKAEIDCFDDENSMGKGYPYRKDTDKLILNLKTRKLSYDYENNDDLADWLQENKKRRKGIHFKNCFWQLY